MEADRAQAPLTRCLGISLRQHDVFSLDQALACGATKDILYRACRAGKLTRPLARVYSIAGARPTWKHHLMSLCLWANGLASHRSAAALWQLDGCEPGHLDIVTTARRDRPFAAARIHQVIEIPECDITQVDSIPVTSPSRTLLDLASVVDDGTLELAMEDALRRRLTSIPRLKWQLQRMGRTGRSGTARLRRVMEERGNQERSTESALETRFARWLRSTPLPPPVRQLPVKTSQRSVRIDFAYPDERVAIEVDSYRYHSGRAQWYRDRTKARLLQSQGWTVISVAQEDLAEPAPLEEVIARALGISLL